jgi:hypothetical protein
LVSVSRRLAGRALAMEVAPPFCRARASERTRSSRSGATRRRGAPKPPQTVAMPSNHGATLPDPGGATDAIPTRNRSHEDSSSPRVG